MGDPNPEAELADIRAALQQEHASAHEPVFQWKYRFPLFLAISIGAFNQLSGINSILYYLPGIFQSAGFTQPPSHCHRLYQSCFHDGRHELHR